MIFLTGATGYIGSYVAAGLLRQSEESLALLVRARDTQHAIERLWQAWQLHMPFEEFEACVSDRVRVVCGDLSAPDLGLDAEAWRSLAHDITSVIHVAASLNRKSAKSCFNVNLRGTLSVIRLAGDANAHHGLRRFSDVSTVAVAGRRSHELVDEAHIIDWDRSDYDPYARTKKFCEHMVHELLPDVDRVVFRPSTVLGDSRFPETTQFDMVRAFVMLAKMPVLPFNADWRMDIVPADYVSEGIVRVHLGEQARHESYNLSAGSGSESYRELVDSMVEAGHRAPRFMPRLERGFTQVVETLSNTPKHWRLALPASLLKVFMPYLVFDTVFDNTRIVEELGSEPAPFSSYAHGLFNFATETDFTYPYTPWPT